VIADGVFQGYIEARAGMAQVKVPARPWSKSEQTRASRDWVAEVAALAQRPGAERLAPVETDQPVMTADDFRRRIQQGRADAIARSRVH
jgi:hypothetical protein